MRPVVRWERVAAPTSLDLLTPAERERHDRLVRPADRAAYAAAHLLVRACAAEVLGRPVEQVVVEQRCDGCGRAGHGRPSVAGAPEVAVSLSHTAGWVAAVVARVPAGRSVGVDVEAVRPVAPPARALTAREAAWVAGQPDPGAAFTRLWVRKEALVKAGLADLGSVGELDVIDGVEGYALADWASPGSDAMGALALPG